MAKLTQQERLCRALVALGFVESRATVRFRVFKRETFPTFYIGKAGALRYSHKHKVTETAAASDATRQAVLTGDIGYLSQRLQRR